MAFKMRQNPFSAGAPPRTPLGELTTLPRPPCRLKRGHPSRYPTPLGTNPPFGSRHASPQNSSQIYAYGIAKKSRKLAADTVLLHKPQLKFITTLWSMDQTLPLEIEPNLYSTTCDFANRIHSSFNGAAAPYFIFLCRMTSAVQFFWRPSS